MARMVLPICGDFIETDEIVGVTYLEPAQPSQSYQNGWPPRVRIDTRRQFAANIIECDSVEAAKGARDLIIAACMEIPAGTDMPAAVESVPL